jgi:8-oxo-dGTP diphosphatase
MTNTDTIETTDTDELVPVGYTADAVVWRPSPDPYEEIDILLIRRRWTPFEGQWALPGGIVAHETSRAAAARELAEETGIVVEVDDLEPVGVFDEPGRDPRGRVVSVAYVIQAPAGVEPVAGDDAAEAAWVGMSDANGLAFDHDHILNRALATAFPIPPTAHIGDDCTGCDDPWCRCNAPAAVGEDLAAEEEEELEVPDPDPEMAVRIVYSGGDDETLWRMSDEEIAELTKAFGEGRTFTRRWGQTTQVFLPAQVTRLYIYDANNAD